MSTDAIEPGRPHVYSRCPDAAPDDPHCEHCGLDLPAPGHVFDLRAALAVIDSLPWLVQTRRRALGLGLRGAAAQIGVSTMTLVRLELGDTVHSPTLVRALRWLDSP